MKRLTMADLRLMHQAHPGTDVAEDNDQGIAVLDIGRAVYYARLDDEPVRQR